MFSDLGAAVAGAYIDRIELRTNASEPVVWTGAEIQQSIRGPAQGEAAVEQQPSAVLSFLKPTLLMKSETFGDLVWAPYGVADTETWRRTQRDAVLLMLGGAAAIFGLGYWLGKRRKA
jgi:hypothetical protein